MKFTCSVTIDKPIDQVVELWKDPNNLSEWQDGFDSFEHLEGDAGQVGAKSRFFYKMGKRDMELIETILVSDLPREFTSKYEHKSMTNTMRNTFHALDDNRTRWDAELDYIEIRNFILRLMTWINPRLMRKMTQKWLDQFKAFAERSA